MQSVLTKFFCIPFLSVSVVKFPIWRHILMLSARNKSKKMLLWWQQTIRWRSCSSTIQGDSSSIGHVNELPAHLKTDGAARWGGSDVVRAARNRVSAVYRLSVIVEIVPTLSSHFSATVNPAVILFSTHGQLYHRARRCHPCMGTWPLPVSYYSTHLLLLFSSSPVYHWKNTLDGLPCLMPPMSPVLERSLMVRTIC